VADSNQPLFVALPTLHIVETIQPTGEQNIVDLALHNDGRSLTLVAIWGKEWRSFHIYFTPRPLIRAIVDVMRPAPGQTIHDPACGTSGFLLIAHDYVSQHHELDRDQKKHLKLKALSGNELVDSVARLCVMNLYLHGVGGDDCPIDGGVDSLAEKPSVTYDMVLTNPPFGKKSSITVINEEGDERQRSADLCPRRFLGDHQQQATQLPAAREIVPEDSWASGNRRTRQCAVRRRRRRDDSA
jgi:hypothetical protein